MKAKVGATGMYSPLRSVPMFLSGHWMAWALNQRYSASGSSLSLVLCLPSSGRSIREGVWHIGPPQGPWAFEAPVPPPPWMYAVSPIRQAQGVPGQVLHILTQRTL
jgi:hypothetical protein